MPEKAGLAAAAGAAASYRQTMANFAGRSELDIWYDRVDPDRLEAALHPHRVRVRLREPATS